MPALKRAARARLGAGGVGEGEAYGDVGASREQ